MLYYAYLENIKKDFAFWGFCFLAGVVGGGCEGWGVGFVC